MKKLFLSPRVFVYLFAGLFVTSLFLFINIFFPAKTKSANFTNAYASLGNSRFSYYAGVLDGDPAASGESNVIIDTTGNPDKDVDHLFPKDGVCFAPSTLVGCRDDKEYVVVTTETITAGSANQDQFTISEALTTSLAASDLVIASSSGSLSVSFTLVNNVPDGGDILITIPSDDDTITATSNDGFPDVSTTVAAGGFDLNKIAAGDVSTATTTSGTCNNAHWSTTETITPGNTTTDHVIRIDRSGSECEANSTVITVTIDADPGIVNPPPINTSRTQGVADAYTLNVKTRDNTDSVIDSSDVMVAPVEAVFVSATIDETLAFTVTGEASGNTRCGLVTDVTTTAMTVPWGTITSTSQFYEASQYLTVSTNAVSGYSVYTEETDQMGKDGATCTGTAPSAGEYTFSGATCIRDTLCGATPCTESAGYNWTSYSSYPGLGFSLENKTNTDSTFVYNSNDPCTTSAGAGSFCARQFADTDQGGETRYSVMTNTGPVSSNESYVCYRLAIPGTQPAGYYYNKVRYTAVPLF